MRQPGGRQPAPEPLDLIQDLANSFDLESGYESLLTPGDLDAFARAHGLGDPEFTEADLEWVRRLRDALRESCIVKAGHEPAQDYSSTLNAIFATVPMSVVMTADAKPSLAPTDSRSAFGDLAARVQAAIYQAEATGTWPRLKACQSETCRWVYFDNSPSARSRWCTMGICGARAKMRAYRARSTGPSTIA